MKIAPIMLTLLALWVGSVRAIQQHLPPTNATQSWPGRMPNEERAKLRPLLDEFLKAMRQHDDRRLAALRAEIVQRLGKYAGVSEDAPDYSQPLDASTPDFAKVEALWLASFKRMQGRQGWEQAARANAQGRPQPRLRVSFRHARAYLQSQEAGLTGKDELARQARRGFDYIASTQASTGVFGFPYFPNAKDGLLASALRLVTAGEARGLKMTEGAWIIEDLEDGGLQFDNGEAGLGLLYAYALTGQPSYLEAARRAGAWAAKRPLVGNFNYNGFSGELLARLYRVTGERAYLTQAVEKLKYGVLPGQMENGRWFDQHNAAIQYHSIIQSQLIELYLAFKQAGDPYADEVKRRLALGLDNLAGQINTYGAVRGKAQEMLCLDALVRGLLVFGPQAQWERAANIDVNYLCNQFLPELEKHGEPMTETVAQYLLYRRVIAGKAQACEITLEKCVAAVRKAG